jgi:hypothetical protein
VLPQDAEVLLVQADGVLEGDRLAAGVRDDAVEVADLAEAVAAQLEAIGERARCRTRLRRRRSSASGWGRDRLGDDHLGQRSAVQDGPDAAAILIADGVEDEALSWSEPDAEPPFLPVSSWPDS